MNLATGKYYKELAARQAAMFVTGDELRKLQLVLTRMTKDIAEVCEECGATYFLGGGNALGAVRHQGYIPWDDDMDLNILSKDFEMFISAFKNKYGDKYDVYDKHTKDHCSVISYISLKGSLLREIGETEEEAKGICVSLDKIENVPNNPILRRIHGTFCDGFSLLLSCRNIYENRKSFLAYSEGYPEAQRAYKMKIAIGWCTKLLTVRGLNRLTQWIHGLCKNENSEYINIPCGRKHYFGDMYLRTVFMPPKKTKFEDCMFCVPAQPEKYLAGLYGEDFMEIPPVEKREHHPCMELKLPDWSDEL